MSHVLMGVAGGAVEGRRAQGPMDRFKAGGIEIINMMIGGFNDVIWGGPKAEEQTANVVESIKVAGKLGLPVIEYNFYAHRLTEGYKLEEGPLRRRLHRLRLHAVEGSAAARRRRHAHAGATARTRPTLPQDDRPGGGEGQRPPGTAPERPAGAAVARLRTDHGDPSSTGKVYLDLVKSPFNGMTFDCGVTRELGEDPVKVCRYLSERDCINHVHFRNVVVRTPYVDYTEVFLDDGQVDPRGDARAAATKVPARHLSGAPRLIDMDREHGKFQNRSILAAAASPARPTTSATLALAGRPR